ncbi:hypothetical protein HYD90_03825 [Mycoplasmopsis bovis]|nr:hypothetical protein [Mycoplasmopsis bovis]QQH36022.1 hypothetical protein HYD90_03825 [Mycoplasmopsis bovis]
MQVSKKLEKRSKQKLKLQLKRLYIKSSALHKDLQFKTDLTKNEVNVIQTTFNNSS